MKNLNPIGIFDSGFGGLSIFREIEMKLPQYDYIYLGDNARSPYGEKSFEEVYAFTLSCVKWLFEQNCNLVILACNTASAKALRTIQQHDLPAIAPAKRVLGIIRPTSEIIGNLTVNGHVGLLGTRGTVQSQSYVIETDKFFPGVQVTQLACPEWVDLVENDLYDKPEADPFVKKYLDKIMVSDPDIDTILLACTHYPLLLDKIRKFAAPGVQIVSQGPIIAQSLESYLMSHPELICSEHGSRSYFTTGDNNNFDLHGSVFMRKPVFSENIIIDG